ncbi:RNA polymerase sigma factor [Leptospira selangorensis]|uniref:RNA polymerase sigma factor n=1 Tax=Leptospira selangorensis TaxID=2484982 RepID=A0A4V3JDE1_9LEPT|nr:RNA polymerase sigma factor [Leptospira selangorensis]TGK09589.1 RNA polymerase sigma factor [Leptospira selangorensis]TGM16321.1 RNA polymerase sigma factor [Leptospira selangorensis]TGM17728.1 RNA polymerase sigma factor [Leptospira selangorensis]
MGEAEFSRFVEETREIVLAAVSRYLYERFAYAIDDVAQETYLRAYKALQKGQFRGDSKLTTWLYTIARNESIRMNENLMREETKAEKAGKRSEEDSRSFAFDKELPEDREDLPTWEKAKLWIGNLPEAYRSVIQYYLSGYSEKEIAEVLGVPAGTVKSRAARGKEMLRRMQNSEKREGGEVWGKY